MVPPRGHGPSAHSSQGRARPRRERALLAVTVATGLLTLAVFGYLARLRPPQSHLWGDEGTYLAMTASLVRDGDLRFDEPDRDWALERGALERGARDDAESESEAAPPNRSAKGVTVILQRTPKGITYSKPLLYPLLAALPYALLGEAGLVVLNIMALALGAVFAALYLGRLGIGGLRWLTLMTFMGCSAVIPYLAWRMGESLQVGLALSGLVLACGALRANRDQQAQPMGLGSRTILDHAAAPWVGGVLLGLLTAMRTSNALLLAGAIVASLVIAGLGRSSKIAGGAAAALLVVLSVSQIGLGTISPYTAERASFNARIGYPVGPDAADALARFDEKPATHQPYLDLSAAQRYSALYFFVGRHTGLLAYFPLALAMMYLLLRRPDRLGLVMLATAMAMATFYLLYTPHNYFGGSTFIGNRYFLVAYPALLVGLAALPPLRLLLPTLAIGLVFGISAVGSVRLARDLDGSSQSHTAAGAFRRLPYETTAREIQGEKYRFWSGDYLRFTSPWAGIQRRRFVLHSDRPYAELMLARSLVPVRTYFLVRPASLAAAITWRSPGSGWHPLRQEPQVPGLVSIETGRTWRQHPLGWASRAIYDLRMLQMRLASADADRRQVDVYYLGGDAGAALAPPPELVALEVPSEAEAGTTSAVTVVVRNVSEAIWTPDDVLPITLGYRLSRDGHEVERAMRPIERSVGPGATASFDLDVDWPALAGEYGLALEVGPHPIDVRRVDDRVVTVLERR